MARSPASRLIALDLDNTLVDWIRYYANAFGELLAVASSRLGVDQQELARQFKLVHARYHSIEFPFSLQRIPATADVGAADLDRLILEAQLVFREARRRYLKVYPGTFETLDALRGAGHQLAIVTNAPAYQARRRVRDLGLGDFISVVVAWEGWDAADLSGSRDRAFAPLDSAASDRFVLIPVPRAQIKPAPTPYLEACRVAGTKPSSVVAVGDSLRNDLAPARALGAATVWARYGLQAAPEEVDIILSITQFNDQQLGLGEPDQQIIPDAELTSISELPAVVDSL